MEAKKEIPQREMVDAIQSCIKGINKKLTDNQSQVSAVCQDHLNAIRVLLQESLDANPLELKDDVEDVTRAENYNIAKIHQVLSYIETMVVQPSPLVMSGMWNIANFGRQAKKTMGLNANEQMRDKLKAAHFPIMPKSALRIPTSNAAVPSNEHAFFGSLHLTLREQLQRRDRLAYLMPKPSLKPVGDPYSYPVDNGQVMNDVIGKWQNDQMLVSEAVPHRDFTRSISFRGFAARNPKEVDELLDDLIKSSNYADDEKESVRTWLCCNGGQGNIFPALLLERGDYTGGMPADLMGTVSLKRDWTIHNGRCVMNVDIVCTALRIRTDKSEAIVAFHNQSSIKTVEPEAIKPLTDPLLRFKYQIELKVGPNEAGQQVVTPCVTKLKVMSFTRAQELSLPKQEAPSPATSFS